MQFHIEAIEVGNRLQNYIWMLIDQQTQHVVAIDPTQADLVLDYCTQHQLRLKQIWITHKHADHIGGVAELRHTTHATVYAPLAEQDHIVYADHWLQDDDTFQFSDLNVDVMATAGHTHGHICYFIDALDALFCGDTLFAMGCGRLFEGTATQMYRTLNRLAALPPRTQVYCTHEYTLNNAEFALSIEPENMLLQQRHAKVQTLRQQGLNTLPSTIALELQTNPFLRCQSAEEFGHLRRLKDLF
ncbi:MAG: hydroxyacylglutathione hydrolase [Acinetobacter sp.]|nr:MAG: hydroxyacylglutathione hydrolase [Acinetobacter sp.]